MSKKKRTEKSSPASYNNNPFNQLKGFAASGSEEELPLAPVVEAIPVVEKERTFADEMDFLGVDPLDPAAEITRECPSVVTVILDDLTLEQSDENLFLESLGQLDVRFSDHAPQKIKPAAPRRLKQLKQGRLTPDASLDLHGLQRHQVAGKIKYFLQNATYHQWQTVLIVTGRGLHSPDGEPVLRDEAEKVLATAGNPLIAEWGRAPRQYGGEGALVVFLKKSTQEHE